LRPQETERGKLIMFTQHHIVKLKEITSSEMIDVDFPIREHLENLDLEVDLKLTLKNNGDYAPKNIQKFELELSIPEGVELPYHNLIPEEISHTIFKFLINEIEAIRENL